MSRHRVECDPLLESECGCMCHRSGIVRLPGLCVVCRAAVMFNGKRWVKPGKGGSRHVCREERPRCGAWMPSAKERCARKPGHGFEHRTAYALGNAARSRTGQAAA